MCTSWPDRTNGDSRVGGVPSIVKWIVSPGSAVSSTPKTAWCEPPNGMMRGFVVILAMLELWYLRFSPSRRPVSLDAPPSAAGCCPCASFAAFFK